MLKYTIIFLFSQPNNNNWKSTQKESSTSVGSPIQFSILFPVHKQVHLTLLAVCWLLVICSGANNTFLPSYLAQLLSPFCCYWLPVKLNRINGHFLVVQLLLLTSQWKCKVCVFNRMIYCGSMWQIHCK